MQHNVRSQIRLARFSLYKEATTECCITRQEHTRREAGPQSKESQVTEIVRLPKVSQGRQRHSEQPEQQCG